MRLDLFLKVSRLCPRRTVAQKLCEAGLVQVDGRSAKAGHRVKPGDEITIRRRDHITTVRISLLPEGRQTSRQQAGSLFEVLKDELIDGDDQ